MSAKTRISRDRRGIVRVDQRLHVRVEPPLLRESVEKSSHGQIRDRVKAIEHDTVSVFQFTAIVGLERRLVGRQRRSQRVVYERQVESGVGASGATRAMAATSGA